MITGLVNARHEVTVRIPVQDATGQEQEIEAILDTGFDRALTLPPATIARLGLPWDSHEHALLADGTVVEIDIHIATVIWDGSPLSVYVECIDAPPLLGRALLVGHDVRMRVVAGGSVEIEAIP